ncbi:alpha/beta hydrolase family protein, partial [Candidatus Hakubella thermalkaliphila]
MKQRRYDELIEPGKDGIERELAEVRSATKLTKPDYHLRVHGHQVGAESLNKFMAAIRSVQQDKNARVFTYRNPRFGNQVHWALISVERGWVMVYNTDRKFIFRAGYPICLQWGGMPN